MYIFGEVVGASLYSITDFSFFLTENFVSGFLGNMGMPVFEIKLIGDRLYLMLYAEGLCRS